MNGRRVGQVPRVGAVAPGGPGPDGEVVEVLLKAGSRRGRVVALLVDLCGRDRFRESEDGTNLTPIISPSKSTSNKALHSSLTLQSSQTKL